MITTHALEHADQYNASGGKRLYDRSCSVYLLYATLINTLFTNELDLQWPFQGVVGRRILDL